MTIRVGILGMGFMGRTHLRAYRAAERDGFPCRVVAVASLGGVDLGGGGGGGAAARGNLESGADDPGLDAGTRVYSDAESLAADDDVDLVSLCTPTDTHVPLAALLLESGKHVLVEKPVALASAEIPALAAAAARAGRLCIPAMCMRYWPGWDWLIARVRDGSLGGLTGAAFFRAGPRPSWSPEFYTNPARCGGALLDLHIHDADLILHLLGPPRELASTGTIDRITTEYRYPRRDGAALRLTAEGAWLDDPLVPFRMRYRAEFEHAAADWDLARPLAERLLVTRGTKTAPVPLSPLTGYDGEVRAVVRALDRLRRGESGDATSLPPLPPLPALAEARAVLELLEAERASLGRT